LEERDDAHRHTRVNIPEAEFVSEITLEQVFIGLYRWHQIENGGVSGQWVTDIRPRWVTQQK